MNDMGKTSPAPDPFDPAALRLDQSFAETVGVRKLLTTVPVRKPNRQDFVRVHPHPAYRLTPAAIIELREDREIYLVTPHMASQLPGEFAAATLFTTINRQGVLHLWPVKLPGADGKHNEWHRSAAEAAERAIRRWVRVTANMSLGAYEIFEATGDLLDPTWPDLSFSEILKIAFRDRIQQPIRIMQQQPIAAVHRVLQRWRTGRQCGGVVRPHLDAAQPADRTS